MPRQASSAVFRRPSVPRRNLILLPAGPTKTLAAMAMTLFACAVSTADGLDEVTRAHARQQPFQVTKRVRLAPRTSMTAEQRAMAMDLPDVDWHSDETGKVCMTMAIVEYLVDGQGSVRADTRNTLTTGNADRLWAVVVTGPTSRVDSSSRAAELATVRTFAGQGPTLAVRGGTGEYLTTVLAALEVLQAAADRTETSRDSTVRIESRSAEVALVADAFSGEVVQAEFGLGGGRRAVFAYEGRQEEALFPARYPVAVWSRVEPQPAQVSPRDFPDTYDAPTTLDRVDPSMFSWKAVALYAYLEDSDVVVNRSGEVDNERTLIRRRERDGTPPMAVADLFIEAPDGSLTPRPRGSGFRGWLLAGGVTCVAMGLGVWYRRRAA